MAGPREYLFFRHAEAENQDPQFTAEMVRDSAGRADYPLSERGRQQAALAGAVARSFGAELVLSSSLRRARETAELAAAAGGLPSPIEDPDLDEVNPGRSSLRRLSFAGRDISIVSLALATAFVFDRRVAQRRSGESAPELLARIRRVFERLEALPASRVAIFGHGYWMFTAALLITPTMVRKLGRARTISHGASMRVVQDASGLRVTEL